MSTADLLLRTIDLASQSDRIGMGDLQRAFGVSRSAAYRALRTLEEGGYLLLAPTGRGYGPGPRLVRLREVPPLDAAVRRRWTATLAAVRDATGETVHATVLVGGQALALDGRRSAQDVDLGSRIGMAAPAHSMAAGKLLLAALDDRLVRELIPAPDLPQRTSRTIADVNALLAELARIRREGYAIAIQESEEGVDSIAVPLDGSSMRDRVAAVVSVPSARGGVARLRRLGARASETIAQAGALGTVHLWRLSGR